MSPHAAAGHSLILGLESSCDETAAAVVEDGRIVRASVVASQHDLHRRYRGVVPEIASRAHLERILPVVREALAEAGVASSDLDAVAVGIRPGLIGSLLVGTSAAKGLAWGLDRPFFAVDHVEAHLHAGALGQPPLELPALGLVVSGGHTNLFEWRTDESPRCIGRTIDDAAGEAFDKAATMLGLEHPGGPRLEALARGGDPTAISFPRPLLGPQSLDFSFSGLKTAMRQAILDAARPPSIQPRRDRRAAAEDPRLRSRDLPDSTRADLAAGFERAVVETIAVKLRRGIVRLQDAGAKLRTLVAGGGVIANGALRRALAEVAAEHRLELRLPEPRFCVDNAAMIAAAAAPRLARGERDDLSIAAEPRSRLASG